MTADIAQAEEAATKLLEGDSDKSMQKFQAKNADFFGEYANPRSATGTRRLPRGIFYEPQPK